MVWSFKAGNKCLNGKPSFWSKIPQKHYIQVTKLLCIIPAQMRRCKNLKSLGFFSPVNAAPFSNKVGFTFFRKQWVLNKELRISPNVSSQCLVNAFKISWYTISLWTSKRRTLGAAGEGDHKVFTRWTVFPDWPTMDMSAIMDHGMPPIHQASDLRQWIILSLRQD